MRWEKKNSCIIASNIFLKLNYNKTNRIDWRIFWEGERGGALFLCNFTLIFRKNSRVFRALNYSINDGL
jgi:hypothetical protein